MVGAVGEDDEATGRDGHGQAREACRAFPLVKCTVHKNISKHFSTLNLSVQVGLGYVN